MGVGECIFSNDGLPGRVGFVTVYLSVSVAAVTPFDTVRVPVCVPTDRPFLGAIPTVAAEFGASEVAESGSFTSNRLLSSKYTARLSTAAL